MSKKSLIAIIACVLALDGCNYNVFNPTKPPNFVKVYRTGNEQQIIEQYSAEDRQLFGQEQASPNALDEAFHVLRSRAYPTPNDKALIRAAIQSMCQEYESQTQRPVPSAHREAWIWSAYRNQTFQEVLEQFNSAKPRPASSEKLVEEGLRGMLHVAGPRSAQLLDRAAASAFQQIQADKQTPEEGIVGITVDRWPVVEVLPLSPAAEAGLKDGDEILSINGEGVDESTSSDRRDELLEGPAGSQLTVTFRRDGKAYRAAIRRGTRSAMSVRASIPTPGVCYLRIPTFEGTGVADKVRTLVKRASAAGVKSFLLDLRGNSGGSITEANAIADLFVDNRPLQTFAFRIGRRVIFKASPGRIDADVLVLTNRSTASAAEMLAMGLRDNQAARIVGEDTFGALFGKEFHQLACGHILFFRAELTILSPQGEDYSLTGIPPDLAVEDRNSGAEDAIYAAALQQARQTLVARAQEPAGQAP